VLSTVRIPHAWNPKAKCPAIDAFLETVLPADCIDFVLEVIGYCLIPDNRMQRAVMLVGPGGNGKGTLLDLISNLMGSKNIASRTLHELSEERFARADLFGSARPANPRPHSRRIHLGGEARGGALPAQPRLLVP
jgi:putative DNA primase/helicase